MKTFLAKTLAALTAIVIPVAGLPHFDCVCPNGQLKQAPLAITSLSSSCCCQRSAAGALTPRACCAKPIDRSKRSKSGSEINAPSGCQRALTDQEPLTVSSGKTLVVPDQLFAGPLAALPTLVAAPTTCPRDSWQIHSLGPPTDLVILHQRFLI